MATLGEGGVGANPVSPAGQSGEAGSKRKQADAELPESDRPDKRQKAQVPAEITGLANLVLGGWKDDLLRQAALDMFSDPGVLQDLRSIHYSYEKFRAWLLKRLKIPLDANVCVYVFDRADELVRRDMSPEDEFHTVLLHLSTGALRAVQDPTLGNALWVYEHPSVALRVQRDDNAAAATAAPEPLQTEESPARKPTPQPEEEPQPEEQGLDDVIVIEGESEDAAAAKENTPDLSDLPVLDAEKFLETIQAAADAEDPKIHPALKDEPEADQRLFKFDAKTFKKALLFFDTKVGEDGRCKIKMFNISVTIWQLYTVYELLMRPVTTGVNGACVGLDVGFGKTILTLLYLVVRTIIFFLNDSVQKEWKSGNTKDHLPKDNKDPSKTCPSQHKATYMVTCPCVYNSDTRAILTYMADAPALIVIPPGLKRTWLNEILKAIPDFARDNSLLFNFWFYFSDKTEEGTDISGRVGSAEQDRLVQKTSGIHEVVIDDKTDENTDEVRKGPGSSKDVFIISTGVVNQLDKIFKPDKEKRKRLTLFTASVIVLDEYQKYRGVNDKTQTAAFTFTETIAHFATHPVTLLALSGTTIEEGPTAFRCPARHYLHQWRKWGTPNGSKGHKLKSLQGSPKRVLSSFEDVRKNHKQLVRAITDGKISQEQKKIQASQIRWGVSLYILAIRQQQIWRGRVLNQLLPCKTTDIIVGADIDEKTLLVRKGFMQSVDALMYKELDELKIEWEDNKSAALESGDAFDQPIPTIRDLYEDGPRNTNDKAYLAVVRALTYPFLLAILAAEAIDASLFSSGQCQTTPIAVQRAMRNGTMTLDDAREKFKKWEFYEYRKELARDSPKLKRLAGLIDKLMKDNNIETGPADRSGVRHALIYHTQAISACLTYLFILFNPSYRGKVEPILITSGVKMDERQKLIAYMNEDCKPGSRNKLLIAVTEVTAEGFNLQRVNNAWFMELPQTLPKLQQAIGRVHRSGQQMPVNVVKMYDETNLVEKHAYQGLNSKEQVADLIYNVKKAGNK